MGESPIGSSAIVVRFSRPGAKQGIELDPAVEYSVTVNAGASEAFYSPWSENELEDVIETLRNEDAEGRPNIGYLREVGRTLGEALEKVPTLASELYSKRKDGVTVYLAVEFPELARIPWELASWWVEPRDHILLTPNITLVRSVPSMDPAALTQWPTGKDAKIRMLFIYGQKTPQTVPWEKHLETLRGLADVNDVELTSRAIDSIIDMGELTNGPGFDYVHVLAHGARTENGEWGLQLGKERIEGAQLARALRLGDRIPSLVTLAACDSGNETDSKFGSVAYELHAQGIPMVVASQFRLRKSVADVSVARVYEQLLAGEHPLSALSGVRRQLAMQNNEAWSNEVVYTKYSLVEMAEGAAVARQQAVLRQARRVAKELRPAERSPTEAQDAIKRLRGGIRQLRNLAEQGFDLGETYGLLGSLARRIAYIASDPPDPELLRTSRDYYQRGLEAVYSHYCGINAIHLSWVIDDPKTANDLLPIVRFITNREQKEAQDYWAEATSGELAMYSGDAEGAAAGYRRFVSRLDEDVTDQEAQRLSLNSARNQLVQFLKYVPETGASKQPRTAAAAAVEVLDSAVASLPAEEPVEIEAPVGANAALEETSAVAASVEPQRTDGLAADALIDAPAETVFTIEMLPAALGDSLWIEWGNAAKPRRILVDGGLSGTADIVRAKIDAVAATEGTCRLELLVVTHIDGDHIEGIIKLLGQPALPVEVGDVWFNGRRHMPDPNGEDDEEFLGARHGEFLSAIIEERGLNWNQWRDGRTIYVPPESRGKLPTLELPEGLKLTLLSPGYPELVKLSKTWEKELVKAGLDLASHEEILAALIADRKLAPADGEFLSDRPTGPPDVAELLKDQKRKDGSHANGASIAFLAEFDGRSCLLTGDAHWPVLVREVGRLLKERRIKRLPLTALKVPHHGSRNNMYDDLLTQLDCHRYLVSTDGSRFRHPDGAALARAVGGPQRGALVSNDDPVDLIFNYRTEHNDVWDDDDLRDTWNYKTRYPAEGEEGYVFDVIAG